MPIFDAGADLSKDITHLWSDDAFVSGHANPMGLGATLSRDGQHALMNVTLGKSFEGPPGYAHGGVVASLIDETMGLVLVLEDTVALTAQLDVRFRAPTPIGVGITAEAWLEKRDGRKLFMEARVSHGDAVLATASALFIAIDPASLTTTGS
jgi:acyl-coenzyme A thioesterase PaaI-like protein